MARKPLDQLSPRYRARVERALAKGKTRQEARGHKAREHVERARKEVERRGITNANLARVRRWYRTKFNPNDRQGVPTEYEVVGQTIVRGSDWFNWYSRTWNSIRQNYVREQRAGKWASRGTGFLGGFEDEEDGFEVPDISWLYYH